MRKSVGISLRIRRAWMDAFLDRATHTADEAELRTFLDELLAQELPGRQVRAKTAGIIMRVWSTVPKPRVPLRDRALAMVPSLSGDDRLWLHWGMAAIAYPFFRDAVEVIGRLLALQDDFSTQQVQVRLTTAWGDRLTTRKSARYLLNTLTEWGVLQANQGKGRFTVARKVTTRNAPLQLWLLAALLGAGEAEEVEVQQLLRLPGAFPFSVTVGVAELRKHEGFNIHRQGSDMDMAALRPVKAHAPEKPPKVRAVGMAVQQGLFDEEGGQRLS